MSWVLSTDGESDAVPVMTMANGEEALEVIFVLKEVRFVPPVISYLCIMFPIMSFFRGFFPPGSRYTIQLFYMIYPPSSPSFLCVLRVPPILSLNQTSPMQKASLSPAFKSWISHHPPSLLPQTLP